MKFTTITLFLWLMLLASQAQAAIVGFKDWSFVSTNQSWNEISANFDENGRATCSSITCSRTYWASGEDLMEMLAIATDEQLFSHENGNNPLFLGSIPSICPDAPHCIWHGWLRDESSTEPDKALSAVFQSFCTGNPVDGCDFLGGGLDHFLPKTWRDQAPIDGGPSITGHFVYTRVPSPSAFGFLIIACAAIGLSRRFRKNHINK